MVLIGKITNSDSTCLLFKLNPALRDNSNTIDTNNVFMMCPLHSLPRTINKIKVQLLGDYNVRINSTIYITVVLFPIQHTFLDFAMGIVEDPKVINENFDELSYVNILPLFDSTFINKPAQILYANKTGIVNNINTSIRDVNYTLGNSKNVFSLPHPGGFILTNEQAIQGMSGSILIIENNIVGIIIASSDNNSENKSFAMAVDMYYILPHILQCVEAIDKYTKLNTLAKLCEYTNMITLINDLTPVVNHLGADYTFSQIDNNNQEKYITILKIHNYMDPLYLGLRQENTLSTFPFITTLNNNNDFVNYFFNKPPNSVIICKSGKYFDKIAKEQIDINFNQNILFANILDWAYRGDPSKPLLLNLQIRTRNTDSSISLSDPKPFTFMSSIVIDNIFNRTEKRFNLQIPTFFFYTNNSIGIIYDSFGMPQKIKFLNKELKDEKKREPVKEEDKKDTTDRYRNKK